MKYFVTLIAVLLAACGTDKDGPTSHNPKPLIAWVNLSDGPREGLNYDAEIKGCAWEVDAEEMEATSEVLTLGGRSLPFERDTANGRFYSLTEGPITFWAQAFPEFVRAGLRCFREEEFR